MTDSKELKPGKDFIGVGAGAVIVRNNKILLLLRSKPPEAGSWSIPGGKVEFGETIENSLIREVKEEIGVDSEVIALLGVTNHIIPEEKVHWLSPPFLVKIHGEPVNIEPDKHTEMKWFDVDNLPKNLTLTASEALNAFKEWSKHHDLS